VDSFNAKVKIKGGKARRNHGITWARVATELTLACSPKNQAPFKQITAFNKATLADKLASLLSLKWCIVPPRERYTTLELRYCDHAKCIDNHAIKHMDSHAIKPENTNFIGEGALKKPLKINCFLKKPKTMYNHIPCAHFNQYTKNRTL
jgi:hypothetical protein